MGKQRADLKQVFTDAVHTTYELLKIMIPISIIVKILSEFGLIDLLGDILSPAMNIIGLPGSFGLVWATAMITNIYGGLLVFFSFSIGNTFSVAQVTILGALVLLAHNLPVEARITQKAGVRLWFMLVLRVGGAFILAWILYFLFSTFHLFTKPNTLLWKPGYSDPSLLYWIIGELRNYVMIFCIIFLLMILMHILKKTGVLEKMNALLERPLNMLGMNKDVASLTIIGMTLGLAYGGGLIIKEAKSHTLEKKDAFVSLSLMGLSHSLIEDTILLLTIGASLVGIFFARILFSILIIFLLIKGIRKLSDTVFSKYFTT